MNKPLKVILWAIGIFWVISLAGGSNNSAQTAQNSNATDTSNVHQQISPSEAYISPTTAIISPSEDTYSNSSSSSSSSDSQQSDSGLSNDNTYTNVDGNEVHSPAYSNDNSVPAGASAQCSDGEYSFSQHRSGTCSGHGGVATWL